LWIQNAAVEGGWNQFFSFIHLLFPLGLAQFAGADATIKLLLLPGIVCGFCAPSVARLTAPLT